MKIFIKEALKLSLLVSVATLAVFAAAFAQTWNPAPANPPSNNAFEPINVSGTTQNKLGNFTANVIGANGFCLPIDKGGCIDRWPTGSGVSADSIKIVQSAESGPDRTTVASCDPGYKVIGGGFSRTASTGDDGTRERAILNYPNTDSSWAVYYRDGRFIVYAVCIKVS